MPNTREKLTEILSRYIPSPPCDTCETPIGHCSTCGIDRLLDYLLDNGVTIQKWIPVTERLPKPYVDVITLRTDLLREKYHAVGLEYIMLHGEADIPAWSKDHMTWKNKVTHWMPLPQPPKEDK